MKYLLLLSVLCLIIVQKSFSQSKSDPGPVERRITDSICNCVVKIDVSKITTKEEATKVYTDCVLKHANLLPALADERKVDLSDKKAMESVGVDIALNLIKQDCKGFKDLALIMGGNSANEEEVSYTASGIFKRIETKGFNYLILTNANGEEKSFLWLKQFQGSEKFMNGGLSYAGKKIKIKYQELEVYLPQAKGYYKVKEIVSLDIQ